MHIYFFEGDPVEEHYIAKHFPGELLHFYREPLRCPAQAVAIANAELVSVFVHSHMSAEVIGALPKLRLIATRSTGFDHIDLTAAKSRAISVANVPTYGENTVAEHTFALIPALSRNLHKAYVRVNSGDFGVEGLQGFNLKGRTIGVIGTGHIGLRVIRIAQGFDMKVVAFDPNPNSRAADVLGFAYVPLRDLLGHSDVITLHAPLTADTHHMIGDHNIRAIKKGAILINTARGALVDTQALVAALDDGILSGAGLDVMEGEEIISEEKELMLNPHASHLSLRTALCNRILLQRPDMIITPHIGFDSVEAVERILDTTIANILAFRAGSAQNVVHT
jgi:D-lactate dehydrogenase